MERTAQFVLVLKLIM